MHLEICTLISIQSRLSADSSRCCRRLNFLQHRCKRTIPSCLASRIDFVMANVKVGRCDSTIYVPSDKNIDKQWKILTDPTQIVEPEVRGRTGRDRGHVGGGCIVLDGLRHAANDVKNVRKGDRNEKTTFIDLCYMRFAIPSHQYLCTMTSTLLTFQILKKKVL